MPKPGPDRAPKRSKHAKAARADDYVTQKYLELIRRREAEMGGARGWKSAVAAELNIHPTHLSRILNGGVSVGWATAMEAARRLAINPDYFADHRHMSELQATPAKRTNQASPRLVELRNAAIAQFRKGMVPGEVYRIQADRDEALHLAEMVLGLDMVRFATEVKEDPQRASARGATLVSEIVRSFKELDERVTEADFHTPEALAETDEQRAMSRAMRVAPAKIAARKRESQ